MRRQKLNIILGNKVVEKWKFSKNINNKKCNLKIRFLTEICFLKDSYNFWHRKLTLKVRILSFLTTFTQLTARFENFLRGWLLVLGLKEGLVECATVCVKSEVILTSTYIVGARCVLLRCNTMGLLVTLFKILIRPLDKRGSLLYNYRFPCVKKLIIWFWTKITILGQCGTLCALCKLFKTLQSA